MCAPRLPSVAPVRRFRRVNSSPSSSGASAVSAAITRRRIGWWITSSGASISGPPHPIAAKHEAAAVDRGEVEVEPLAGPEVSRHDQRGETDADRAESQSEPQPGEGVAEQEDGRPERVELARPEMADHLA